MRERYLKIQKSRIDFWLIGTCAFLVLFGLLAIYDASVVAAYRDFGDKLYYFKNQLMWAGLGSLVFGFFCFFDYHKLLKYSHFFLVSTIFLLVAVLIPHIGSKIYGARRWINVGGFNLQPSELAKLALIFYGTEIISKFEKYKITLIDSFIVFFLPALIVLGLILLEPDLGTALIIGGITMVIYFVGGAPIWHFLLSLPVAFLGVAAIIIKEPYRLARLKSFLDPTYDPQGASYHINQILTALVSGGLVGVGIGASRSKFAFIPEVQTDAIFAIIVEELGFLGGLLLIFFFLFLIIRAIGVGKEACDFKGKVLALGIASLIATQSLLNLASNVALVPLTGIPLPFISYGGSSLLITMAAIGILVNIRRQS